MRNIHCLLLSIILLLQGIQVLGQCDAGDDAEVTICANDEPLDLFERLNGAPITGGYWIDPFDAAFTNPFDPLTDAPGIYKYIVDTDLTGTPCVVNDTAEVDLTIASVPVATFNMDNNESCGSLTTQFTNTTIGPGYTTCVWDFGDGGSSTACNPIHTFDQVGCYDIIFTTSNGIGCEARDTVFSAACVKEEPVAAFELKENPILTTSAIAEFINESMNAVTFEWIIPDVGNFNDINPIVSLPAKEETYFVCLEVMAANGCEDTYCSNVLVRDDVIMYVPNAFTPSNGDNVNNIFLPRLTFVPERYELLIFDRWGNEIFRSNDPSIGWNGSTVEGGYFAPDSYYSYKIKAVKNAEVIERIGQVMILR
ncbi:MAG: T9SS type B sorting domain-containing protein [Flavobacteriales bacterium]|nr:T9SS type B sorting domain-containing protein [Flavobacteriales bacterium]